MRTPVEIGPAFPLLSGPVSTLDVLALRDGSLIAFWTGNSPFDPNKPSQIKAQLFYADGTPKGSVIDIGSVDFGYPDINAEVLSNDRIAVAWTNNGNGQVYQRILGPDGNLLSEATKVSENGRYQPSIAVFDDGGFAVVTGGIEENGGETVVHFYVQRYNTDNQASGPEVRIDIAETASDPFVATGLKGGGVAIAYTDYVQFSSNWDIRVQIQDANGVKDFVVSSTQDKNQEAPAIATLSDGRFIVVWQHRTGETGDGSGSCIKGQILNPDGSKFGGEFLVNVTTQGEQGRPTVEALPNGGFMVSYWQDNSERKAVLFDAEGVRSSPEFTIPEYYSYAGLADGRIIALMFRGEARFIDPRAEPITFSGTAGADHTVGTKFADHLSGGADNDRLSGAAGDDVLSGDAGSDILIGGDGFDWASFATAASGVAASLTAGSAGDAAGDVYASIEGLIGSSFGDTFFGNGSGRFQGGAGNDTYQVSGADKIIESQGGGSDTALASGSYELARDAEVEVLTLVNVASNLAASLTGSDSANIITGHAGSNTLRGQGGNDTIYGREASDTLSGGAGKDIFVFDTKMNKRTNVDKIVDFSVKDDSIWLDNAVFTKLGKGTLAKSVKLKADMFVLGTRAADKEDRIVYDKKTGSLYYDQDGTGSTAQVKIATLSKNLKLTHADFFVI